MSADHPRSDQSQDAPAGSPPGKIVFRCPQGHGISVPAEHVGKKGQCPKCRSIFTVPAESDPEEVARRSQRKPAATQRRPESSGEPPAEPPPVIGPPPEEPVDAGESGPAVFVPDADEPAVDLTEEIRIDVQSGDVGVSGIYSGSGTGPESEVAFPPPEDAAAEHAHVTAELTEWLWQEKRHGGIIEIHLEGGSAPILPTYFYPRLSGGTHGVFASETAEGTVTLTAVAWLSVQKIVVRNVDSVPPGFLEVESPEENDEQEPEFPG